MKKVFADQIECLEAIGQYLAANVPEAWNDIETNVQIAERVPLISSTYRPTGRESREYFGIPVGLLAEFSDCFVQLRELVGNRETGFFKSCRYVLDNGGRYHVDYDY